jgi:hypothetical protein
MRPYGYNTISVFLDTHSHNHAARNVSAVIDQNLGWVGLRACGQTLSKRNDGRTTGLTHNYMRQALFVSRMRMSQRKERCSHPLSCRNYKTQSHIPQVFEGNPFDENTLLTTEDHRMRQTGKCASPKVSRLYGMTLAGGGRVAGGWRVAGGHRESAGGMVYVDQRWQRGCCHGDHRGTSHTGAHTDVEKYHYSKLQT